MPGCVSSTLLPFQVSPHNPRPASGLFGASAHVGAPSKLSKKARPSVGPGAPGPFGAASDVTEGRMEHASTSRKGMDLGSMVGTSPGCEFKHVHIHNYIKYLNC